VIYTIFDLWSGYRLVLNDENRLELIALTKSRNEEKSKTQKLHSKCWNVALPPYGLASSVITLLPQVLCLLFHHQENTVPVYFICFQHSGVKPIQIKLAINLLL
jgi:hypothetical protein